jgi:Ion channel
MIGNSVRSQIRDSTLWASYLRRRYAVLFYSLLAMLVAIPTAAMAGLSQTAMKVFLGACLLAAVLPNGTRRVRRFLVVAILLLILVRFASDRGDLPIAAGWMAGLYGFIGLLAAAGALRFAISAERVDSEIVYAALSTYLLGGLFFGQIYWALEQAWPGSLIGPDPVTDATTVYYSFVTLATLGYGDFLPRSDLARGVATFEVIGGQLFLAVMVARLIGAFGVTLDDE